MHNNKSVKAFGIITLPVWFTFIAWDSYFSHNTIQIPGQCFQKQVILPGTQ